MVAGRPVSPDGADEINAVLRDAAGAFQLLPDGGGWALRFTPERESALALLGRIAHSAAGLLAEEPAPRVRRCGNPRCALYFIDTTSAGRRRWCSMAVCGNRMKVAAHARRERATAGVSVKKRKVTR
jgi:predicted RNA-binding Zn ribbon-like protein